MLGIIGRGVMNKTERSLHYNINVWCTWPLHPYSFLSQEKGREIQKTSIKDVSDSCMENI